LSFFVDEIEDSFKDHWMPGMQHNAFRLEYLNNVRQFGPDGISFTNFHRLAYAKPNEKTFVKLEIIGTS
jgi:hypothetical protein